MKKRIFVLDDEWDMTTLTQTLLTLKGFEVECSNDPYEAIDTLAANAFDLIFVDLMMPEMSGFSVVAKIREQAKNTATPIIVLSAKRLSDRERKEVLQHHARFVRKPISPTQLVEIVQDELKAGEAT